jgi:hypothetical protein
MLKLLANKRQTYQHDQDNAFNILIIFAEFPAAITFGGKDRDTTAPAPTTVFLPSVTLFRTTTFIPSQTFSSRRTGAVAIPALRMEILSSESIKCI